MYRIENIIDTGDITLKILSIVSIPKNTVSPTSTGYITGFRPILVLTYREVLKGETGPTALNIHLGWILSGPAQVKEAPALCSTFVTHVLRVDGLCSNKRLEKELHAFWDIESLGITENESIVQGQFKSHVSFQDGRYVVALPWKDSCLPLPNNYRLSLRRLNSLFKRLKDTPDLLHKYDAIIREQLDLGIVV